MQTREEVMVAVGVDNRALSAGMVRAQEIVNKFRDHVTDSFKKAFSNFGAILTVAGALKGIDTLRDFADGLKSVSDQAGVSTDFLQGFQGAAIQFGEGSDSADRALTKFAVRLGEAKAGNEEAIKSFQKLGVSISGSTEKAIYEAADAIKAIEDPNLRAAAAVELFGEKLGTKLLPVLAKGSDELRKFVDAANKVSEADLEVIDRADKTIKQATRSLTLLGAKAVGTFVDLVEGAATLTTGENPWQTWRNSIEDLDKTFAKLNKSPGIKQVLPGKSAEELKEIARLVEKIKDAEMREAKIRDEGLSDEERLKKLAEEQSRLLKEAYDLKSDSVEFQQKELELAENRVKVAELQKKISKENADQMDRQKKAAEDMARVRVNNIHDQFFGAVGTIKDGRHFATIEEIASNWGRGTMFHWDAKRILQLQQWEMWNRANGNIRLADQQYAAQLDLRKTMVDQHAVAPDPVVAAIHTLEELFKNNGASVNVIQLLGDE